MKIVELPDDIKIKIGENAKENWDLIDSANENYLWFHLKSFPSSHVILESENPTISQITNAALQCKQSTKYRNLKNIKISYCLVKNVKKMEKVGSVCFVSNRKVKDIKL